MKTKLNCKLLKCICALLLLLVVALTCVGCSQTKKPIDGDDTNDNTPPPWASNFQLPNADDTLNKLVEIYGSKDKMFLLLPNNIVRMPCPQGEVVTVNVTCNVGKYAQIVLNDSIDEFNEIFAVINPHYRFAINYNPTQDDLSQKYSVKLSAADNLGTTETSETFGYAHVGYYNNYTELGDFAITIKTDVFNNGSYLLTTFKHELMHLLGAGDAYKNSAATKNTIMQSYTVNGYHHLSATDVAFLDALYRNPELEHNDEQISAYANNYEANCTHTKANLTAAVYHKLVAEVDVAELKNQANAIGYKDLTEFNATVSSGLTLDTTFGSVNISFKELEYAVEQSETYYGSIDAQANKYWHGQQKGLMGNSMGIGYVDYGSGLVYSAPNGNYILMLKTGEFVLAFRLGGSFTNLSALSLTLWHVSK